MGHRGYVALGWDLVGIGVAEHGRSVVASGKLASLSRGCCWGFGLIFGFEGLVIAGSWVPLLDHRGEFARGDHWRSTTLWRFIRDMEW